MSDYNGIFGNQINPLSNPSLNVRLASFFRELDFTYYLAHYERGIRPPFFWLHKNPSGRRGYDEKANEASCEALAMNIDELVEGFGRRMTKQGDNGVMLSIDAKHVAHLPTFLLIPTLSCIRAVAMEGQKHSYTP